MWKSTQISLFIYSSEDNFFRTICTGEGFKYIGRSNILLFNSVAPSSQKKRNIARRNCNKIISINLSLQVLGQ